MGFWGEFLQCCCPSDLFWMHSTGRIHNFVSQWLIFTNVNFSEREQGEGFNAGSC